MMHGRGIRGAALMVALLVALALGVLPALAQQIGHYGSNRVTFERVGNAAPAGAQGKGVVDFRGGEEPESRWRASFRFSGLKSERSYTVVVRGRFGADASDAAEAYTAICSFETDDKGTGNCFNYFSGLARLDIVQLRDGDEDGTRVMQANRNGNFGSINTEPSRYSPGGEIPERAASTSKQVTR
jgi:hypothetical protein